MSDYIKFNDNQREVVELAFEQPLEGTNSFGKKQFTYGIKPIISGEEKFSATEKLHEKIQELGASKGDTIYITKVKDPEINKGFAFFKVEPAGNPVKKESSGPLHASIKKFQEKLEPPVEEQNDGGKMAAVDNHELNIRVEKLEKIVSILWTDYGNRTSDAGHKPGDNDIPF